MGFGKFFENFIEKAPTPQGTTVAPQTTPVVTSAPANVDFPMPPPVPVATDAPVTQKYLDHFMQFLEKNNIAGLDYWEFANTLHKTYEKSGSALTEQNLYDMVLTMFETQGVTSAVLVQTAQKYLDLAAAHKKEFDNFLHNEGSKSVQDKINENTRLEQGVTAADSQIKALEQQIAGLRTKMATDAVTVEANKAFIVAEQEKNKTNKAQFDATYTVVVDKINGDISKIKTYSSK